MEIRKIVMEFPTDSEWGFTDWEIEKLLEQFPGINKDKFDSALGGITCMTVDGKPRIYHCDIITALRCGLENRNIRGIEFD